MASDKLLDDEAWALALEEMGCDHAKAHYATHEEKAAHASVVADHRARIAQAQADAERIAALDGERERMRGLLEEGCGVFAADVSGPGRDWIRRVLEVLR
jgi:hypothetical protein